MIFIILLDFFHPLLIVFEKELKVLQDRLDDSSAKLAEKSKENQKLHVRRI
jgi:hypothetical protein